MPPEDNVDFQCHVCFAGVDMNDRFCRNCGDRFFTPCIFCKSLVDTPDNFCATCGSQRWPLVEHYWYDVVYRTPEFFIRVPLSLTIAAGVTYFLFFRNKAAPRPEIQIPKATLPSPTQLIPEILNNTASLANWCAKTLHLY